jgi:hypothetical protein
VAITIASDLDGIEACHVCRRPLALIETTRETGRVKPTTVLRQLGRAANVPAFLIYYLSDPDGDITQTRVVDIHPGTAPQQRFTAKQHAWWLVCLHRCQACGASANPGETGHIAARECVPAGV